MGRARTRDIVAFSTHVYSRQHSISTLEPRPSSPLILLSITVCAEEFRNPFLAYMIFSSFFCKIGISPRNLWALWKLRHSLDGKVPYTEYMLNTYPFYVLPTTLWTFFLLKCCILSTHLGLLQTTSLFFIYSLYLSYQASPFISFSLCIYTFPLLSLPKK